MKSGDLVAIGLENLWRTKLRTFLTTLGVTIGIGALVSMVSFGTGMQKNVTNTFYENDLLMGLHVIPKQIDLDLMMSGQVGSVIRSVDEDTRPLDEAAVDSIRRLPGVEAAYPELQFPVKISLDGAETHTLLKALPALMGQYKPYSKIPYGRFFQTDDEQSVIIPPRELQNLNILLDDGLDSRRTENDTLTPLRRLPADSILGRRLTVTSSVLDVPAIASNPVMHMLNPARLPVREESITLTIMGIGERPGPGNRGQLQNGIIVPMKTAESIPHMGFTDVWDLLSRSPGDVQAVYVRLRSMRDLDPVKTAIQSMGFGIFSLADQFEEIKKGFLIMDAMLGTVGVIALVVAALGIINTMVMSILERTREIGVMKAIGGSEPEIQRIFVVEAGCIGFFGGILGLLLGWGVTRIANLVANQYLRPIGFQSVNLFYIPWWLIAGAIAFSVLVSLAAGLYPAVRAARVNPVQALRHD